MGNKNEQGASSRRDFLKSTTVAAGAAVATGLVTGGAHAAGGRETIKVGLIGCGGRGTGAIDNVLHAAEDVSIVGLADVFQNRLDDCKKRIKEYAETDEVKKLGNKVDVEGRCYLGLNAYDDLINKSGANYIILATPPGFRPLHLQAAVAAGKNIFTEKPVATDVTGIRKVMEAHKVATEKGLHIVAGTQRRHQAPYVEALKRVHNGDIGDIVGGHCHWNQGILWAHERQKGWTDLEYQLRNWYNFAWLCGDHIVEQHIHNIDVINWGIGSHPIKAVGMGFRTRNIPKYENIYDFFSIDFEYPNGVHVLSTCRQISGCDFNISETLVGSKGQAHTNDVKKEFIVAGKRIANGGRNPYVQEHTDLIDHIRRGKKINELKRVAESTLTAIMGRMSAYSGKPVTWEFALHKSKEDLFPANLDWQMSLTGPPLALPGKTPLV